MEDAADLLALAEDLGIGEDDVRRVLRAAGANAAMHAFDRDCQTRFALDLLRRHVGTDAIRDRLIASYGISERSAYYRLAEALRSLQKRPDGCSKSWDDEGWDNTEASR